MQRNYSWENKTLIFLPPVTTVSRQIYPLSHCCPGQDFMSEPAPSQIKVREIKGAKQTAGGDFRKEPDWKRTGKGQEGLK